MKLAKDLMNTPITIKIDDKISNVVKTLLDHKISRLIVTHKAKPIGIVSEKDLALFLLDDKTKRTMDEIPLKEIMKGLVMASPNTTIKQCATTMLDEKISSLAISTGDKVQGVLTKTDLTKFYAENYAGKRTVGEFMTSVYSWAYADDPLYKVISKMIKKKISRIILRDENEEPIGVLSFKDIFKTALQSGNKKIIKDQKPNLSVTVFRKGFASESGFGKITPARDLMTGKIISVNYDDDLAKVCKILLDKKIHGAGVVSSRNRLVGIISKTDVAQAIATMN
ncbi:MAG: CBS domain-containing protein [Nitrosopumilales archaeon]|nr:MAG: CBS domain-containing protein [Nitrosopumilales archaeon]